MGRLRHTEAHVHTYGWRPNGQLHYPMTVYWEKFMSSKYLSHLGFQMAKQKLSINFFATIMQLKNFAMFVIWFHSMSHHRSKR